MIVPRASGRWTARLCNRTASTAKNSAYRRSWHKTHKRSYASGGGEGGHSTHKASSDLPWAIGSIAITVPSAWYLIQPQLNKKKHDGGHGHGHDDHSEHGKESEGGEEESAGEDQGSEEEKADGQGGEGEGKADQEADQEASGASEEGKSDGSDSESGSDTPDTSDDDNAGDTVHEKEGGGSVEGVRFKGPTSGGTEEGVQGDTRKHIPDAKGASKKRIESDYGMKQGKAENEEQDAGDKDLAASSKPAGDKTTQSGKQEGLSNTDTKHSTDITNNPEKSTKGDGMPDTAKSKGTVDPSRPQV